MKCLLFAGNEFKLFQSPLKARVGISWTSLAWRDSFCRVADMFWFQVRPKTNNLKSYVIYLLPLITSFSGPCTSWKVNENIFHQARSCTDKACSQLPPLHVCGGNIINFLLAENEGLILDQTFEPNRYFLQITSYRGREDIHFLKLARPVKNDGWKMKLLLFKFRGSIFEGQFLR